MSRSHILLGLIIGGVIVYQLRKRHLQQHSQIEKIHQLKSILNQIEERHSSRQHRRYSLIEGTAGGLIGSGSIIFIFF